MKVCWGAISVVVALLARGVPALAAPPAPATRPAADDATARARQWVKIGTEEYAKQHWEVAHDAYLKAWELKQHFAIAANLAEVEMQLGRYREAAEHWKFNLANLPSDRADRRSDAEKQLLECRAHLSVVTVSVSVAGASVTLDGAAIGQSPLSEELWLPPGNHTLEAAHAGYLTSSREFQAVEGESREVALVLDPVPAPRVAPPTAPIPIRHAPAESGGIRPQTGVLIGGSVLTLAAVGVGIGYTVVSNNASGQVDSLNIQLQKDPASMMVPSNTVCDPSSGNRPAACDSLREKTADRNTARNVAVASFVVGGALAVATVATYLLWPNDERATANEGGAKVGVAPWVAGGGRGVEIVGRF